MTRTEKFSTLTYAVRGRVIAKYLGQLGLVLAGLTLVPVAVAAFYGDHAMLLRMLIAVATLAVVGVPLARLSAPLHLQANEALVITALAFVLGSLAAAPALMAAGLPFLDAWFEAVSGVTTTGLSMLATVEDHSRAFLFTRAWMQWYGGLGFVVLSVALLVHHQLASRRLIESAGIENLVSTTRTHARRMLAVYGLLTAAGVLLLLACGERVFAAVTYTLSAVSTGGFAMHDASIAGLGSDAARHAVMLVALCGAVSLPWYYRLRTQHWRECLTDPEPRFLLLACVAVSALLLFFSPDDGRPWTEVLRESVWLGMSAQSTTGFSPTQVQALDDGSKLTLIAAMSIGGSVGSTAGGFKILRLLILLRLLQLTLRRTAMPAHAVAEPQLGGRKLDAEDLTRALLTIAVFGLVVLLSWLAFVAAGHVPLDALFEVVSATGTVGLSTGIAAADLAAPLKLVLIADMLLGRLEIIALLVVLFPATWVGRRDRAL